MDASRLAADVRLLRKRKGWTQARLAHEARVARWVVLAIEGGRAGRQPIERVVAVVVALGGRLSVRVLFQGEGLGRLRDARHAALVESIVRILQAHGWLVATEVSFNIYGERGSIDVLAFHPGTAALLVIEVKSVVPDVGGMFMTFDRKARLASGIALTQRGWEASTVSRLLVLPDQRTARRRVAQHAATFETAVPARNATVKRWLRRPTDALAGLLFLSEVPNADRKVGTRSSSTR